MDANVEGGGHNHTAPREPARFQPLDLDRSQSIHSQKQLISRGSLLKAPCMWCWESSKPQGSAYLCLLGTAVTGAHGHASSSRSAFLRTLPSGWKRRVKGIFSQALESEAWLCLARHLSDKSLPVRYLEITITNCICRKAGHKEMIEH